MSRRIHFEDEAEAEYRQAGVWYESRRERLGTEFFDEVDTTIRQILDLPRMGAPVPGVARDLPVRRLAVKRFPYYVVYLEMAEEFKDPCRRARSAPAWLLATTIAFVVHFDCQPNDAKSAARLGCHAARRLHLDVSGPRDAIATRPAENCSRTVQFLRRRHFAFDFLQHSFIRGARVLARTLAELNRIGP